MIEGLLLHAGGFDRLSLSGFLSLVPRPRPLSLSLSKASHKGWD